MNPINNRRPELVMLWNEQNGKCHYCARKTRLVVDDRSMRGSPSWLATIEHVIPASIATVQERYSISNMVMACYECNHERGTVFNLAL
jgi:5-methylcytosine-specific restriction endonuclease McrA